MVCLLVVFFLNDNEAILLLVKFQINSPRPLSKRCYMLGYLYIRNLGREWVEEKQANMYLTYLLLWVFIRDQFIKETNLINKIIYSAIHHNTKAATDSSAEKYTIRVRKFCKFFCNAWYFNSPYERPKKNMLLFNLHPSK